MSEEKTIIDMEFMGKTLVLIPRENLSELQFAQLDEAARHVFSELEGHDAHHIVLDLERTDYYGSTALGFFVKLWKHVRCSEGNMVFCHVSDNEREILKVTRLDGLWQICANREEALTRVTEK